MNSTQNTSSDWMLMVAVLLVATIIAAIVSPQAELEAAPEVGYGAELVNGG